MHPIDTAPFAVRAAAGGAAAVLTWLAAWEPGSALVGRAAPGLSAAARWAYGAALGYALVGCVVAALALAHGLSPVTAALVPVALLFVRAPWIVRRASRAAQRVHEAAQAFRALDLIGKLALLVCAVAGLTAFVAGALPTVFWDPLAYHLVIASDALRTGTLGFDPALTQTGFPLLGETAALPAYALAGSASAAVVTLGAGVVLAMICGIVAQRYAPGAGPLAAALVSSSALWLWLAPSFYVDIPFALFCVAALSLSLLVDRSTPQAIATAAVCGALAGAAAAVKYPGLVIAPVALVVAVACLGNRRASTFAGFVAGFVLLAAGWYVRSYALTGDPAYPFLSAWASTAEPVRLFAARYVTMTTQWCGGGATAADALLLPWRMLTDPKYYCGDPGYALRLGAIFFLAGLAWIKKTWPLYVLAALLTLVWFAGSRQDRFILPALSLYAALVAIGTATLRRRLRDAAAACLIALGVLGALLNWAPGYAAEVSNSVAPAFSYMRGAQSADDYLATRLESYEAARWIRAHLPAGTRLASLDDVRGYYFGPTLVWLNPYYQPVWALDWSAPGDRRYRPLTKAGIAYLIVNANEAYLARTPTGVDWQVLHDDVARGYLRLLFEANGVALYVVLGPRVRGPRHE